MDTLIKALVFDKSVIVAAFSTTNIVQKARDLHNLSDTATAALGRTLSISAFMGLELKSESEKVSLTIDGGGKLGKIITAANGKGEVRGFLSNPSVELPLNSIGKLDVGCGVGNNGYVTVIKDLGMKEPYTAKSKLVSGEIGEDMAMYYLISEQRPSAVALGVTVNKGVVASAGGVVIQLLPNCRDEIITIVEDIVSNFSKISSLLNEYSPKELIDYYFGHFDIEFLDSKYPVYKCFCSKEKTENVILTLGLNEAESIIDEFGSINVHCDFCNSDFNFNSKDISKIFNNI